MKASALLAGLIIWSVNLLVAEVVAPALSRESLNVWELTSRWPLLAGSRPARIFSSVVLPQPLGPTTVMNSPSRIENSISDSACTGPARVA